MFDFPSHLVTRELARRSMVLLRSLARVAGDGVHHLTVVLATEDVECIEGECIIDGPVLSENEENDPLLFVGFLLAATTTGVNAMLATRTMGLDGGVRFMSWMISDLAAFPATAAQSHMAYCITEDRDLSDPLPPAVSFVDAPALS
ncbi:hypothetical protein [Streptomyces sp. NRRL F-2747]|uniref:hypothetical protein n=1 Tax=Streptomyces sp. NRRL F-2747 TaxID=1463843 RepID=UPI0004C87AD5|nr:hypothetical protein [Streptomyces sp. NRRL F-2747]